MTLKKNKRRWKHLFISAVTCFSSFAMSAPVHAEDGGGGGGNAYIGGLIGYGWPSGTAPQVDSGMVLGGTIGYAAPFGGVAFTYQHDDWKTTNSQLDYGVDQYLFEFNTSSYLPGLKTGLHLGPVTTKIAGASSTDFGFGVHIGGDIPIAMNLSLGVAVYWTYVDATDKYSAFNAVVPVKFHF